jgi:hypothetical protein
MEKAIFIYNLANVNQRKLIHYNRLYIGNEFCEHLLPKNKELTQLNSLLNNQNISLVTPFLSESGLKNIISTLQKIKDYPQIDEIVINDWGLLTLIKKMQLPYKLILGRLLSTQNFRNRFFLKPIIKNINYKLHSTNDSVLPNYFYDFLKEFNIKGIEFNSLIQAKLLKEEIRRNGFFISCHYPYVYLTCTRYCYFASQNKISTRFSLLSCKHKCRDKICYLYNKRMPQKIILKGNAQYIKSKADSLDSIDRIIYNFLLIKLNERRCNENAKE